MTTTIQFYHLLHTAAHAAIPKLVQRALDAEFRITLCCRDAAEKTQLSDALWSANPNSFLPHCDLESADAVHTPIVLSTSEPLEKTGDVLITTRGELLSHAARYSKILDVFDGMDEEATTAARARWKHYKDQGFALQYIKQQPSGGWQMEAQISPEKQAA